MPEKVIKKENCMQRMNSIVGAGEQGGGGAAAEEGEEYLEVGEFHEIDHSNLSPHSPLQLKSVRIAMVSEIEKEEELVSLRYPSVQSLRTHFFTEQNLNCKIPALDEKCVMSYDDAVRALHRRVPTQEFALRRNSWAFWASLPSPQPIATLTKQGKCWSQLKFAGMVQWGKRRHVRFLGHHEAQLLQPNSSNLTGPGPGPGVAVEEEEEEEGAEKRRNKRTRGEEKEEQVLPPLCEDDTKKRLMMTRRCNNRNISTAKKSFKKEQCNKDVKKKTKTKKKKEQRVVIDNTRNKNKQRKISIDRWSAERYNLAEENMLRVMKEKGAVYGNPILRAELRSEARKHIGDTGLLDHLLKHMAGKVAPGGSERFRRRHNAEGAMEYWLESADLVDIRRQAGVQDPYWTPPPGWNIGDAIIMNPHDHHVFTTAQLKEIKQDILQLKQDMLELASKKGEEAVATPTSCLSSLNWEDYGSLVSKQEIYVELMNKKARIEEQLKEISLTLSSMEEQMDLLKPTAVEEPTLSESATPPPALLPSPGDDALMLEKSTATDKAAKIERLRSGFQICKPKGTFMWPNMDVSPQVVVPHDDHNELQKSPSASKPQTQNLPLALPLPNPSSHVKPLAEKRPLSTATLKHVIGPFSPHLSPTLETP